MIKSYRNILHLGFTILKFVNQISPNFQMKFNFTQHVSVNYIVLNIVVASCNLSCTLSSRLWSFHLLRSPDFDQSKPASLDNFPKPMKTEKLI